MSSANYYAEFIVPATVYVVKQTTFPKALSERSNSTPTSSSESSTPSPSSLDPAAPAAADLAPHLLPVTAGEELAIPTACTDRLVVPARIQKRPRETGLIDLTDTSTFELKPSYDALVQVEAHAIARTDGRNMEGAWLKYSRGEPLWIVKDPVPPPPKNRRSKSKTPPCVLKMVSLRTGRVGLVSLQNVCLHPHARVRDRGALFIPQGTAAPHAVANTVDHSDTLTISGKTREHPTSRGTKIIFGINHRTLQYGYVSASSISNLSDQELLTWKTSNLRPEACLLRDRRINNNQAIASRRLGLGEGKDEGYSSDGQLDDDEFGTLPVEMEELVRRKRKRSMGMPEWRKKQLKPAEGGCEARKVGKRRNV